MLIYSQYDAEIKRLYAAWDARNAENDKLSDSEEWAAADDAATAEFLPHITALEATRSAIATASQPRSAWFAEFCKSLKSGQILSEKQLDCFARYAKSSQYTRYKTPVTTYKAIVNGVLYTVTSAGRKVYIEALKTI